ncbi:LysR family transcriptional regulator [Halomonas sp. PBN3]|uniref:LysR family transcriptional regulator n=1 Tax=Halomonas sp. PBN3 TaxID=1397528 RepID=UPI0009DF54F5|nr:LysR family transcriptional regulator [Halomonas sp. PBN3]
MNITTYKYFLTVSKVGSVRKASEILHVSPSAISKQVSNLEHTFQAKLIDRLASGIQLTEEGKIVAHHMEKTIREMEIAKSKIDDINGTLSGTVQYATIEGVAKDWLFPCIRTFREEHPNVNFNGRILGSDFVYEKIKSGSIDFGIVMDTKTPIDIEIIKKFKTHLVVAVPKNHPLSTKPEIFLKDLKNHELAMLNKDFLTRQLIDHSINNLGIEINTTFELDSIEMIKNYVEKSKSATILPNFCAPKKPQDEKIKYININKSEVPECFTMICKKPGRHLIKAASDFISELLEISCRLYSL